MIWIPQQIAPALRALALHRAKRIGLPQLISSSRRLAEKAFWQAVKHSAAYRQLLVEHGINSSKFDPGNQWERLPLLTKSNTFGRFSITELSRPIKSRVLADVLTSSGRGGNGFGFRLAERPQHEAAWFGIDLGLQDAFDVDHEPTLLVNCLPMGVVFRSRAVAVANVSVREDMACAILRELGPRFKQTIICTDPLFLKRLLDYSASLDLDWAGLNTSVIVGEEILGEAQRKYFSARMALPIGAGSRRVIASSLGVGELGLNILFESRETIDIRRLALENNQVMRIIAGKESSRDLPSLFCYNPFRCLLEVVNPDEHGIGELCFTMTDKTAVIPLPRYTTGDLARIMSIDEIEKISRLAGVATPWLPLVSVFGRISDRSSNTPSVEEIKECLYGNHALATHLSGAFRLSAPHRQGCSLIVQANQNEGMDIESLNTQLRIHFDEHLDFDISVSVTRWSDFPHRPMLDYERKFTYLSPPQPTQ